VSDVLVITGSRALALRPEAAAWAKAEIATAFARLRSLGRLYVGDATGPDAWAWELALERFGRERVFPGALKFALDGRVYDMGGDAYAWATQPRRDFDPKRWPLYRNEHLIAAAARCASAMEEVRVLGFVAPWAKTRGTDHTLALAARAGLAVERRAFT
jgi:hypothetical protein